jgi:hypothetical protein
MFEYLLPDGTALPENEVIKLAVQKGLTPDDYVKKNKLTLRPKQKKAEVKKEVTKPVAVEKPVVEKVKPAPIEKFNAKQFAKDLGASKGEGFYTKGEKNIEKSGIKIKQLEDKTVQDVFDNFSDLSYTNLSPEEKNTIDDRSVELLSKKYKAGEDYSLSSNDIELKSKELLALASKKKKAIEGETYGERILDATAAGLNYAGEMFASMPETIYRVFALPQNAISMMTGDKSLEASPEKLKADTGITNPIMDYFIEERNRLGKKNEIYDNANYDSTSIATNLQDGNYTDAFKLLGSGLAESAPISVGLMMGGAEMGIAKAAASSTALFAGPNVREQKEKKLDDSELSTVLKGFGIAGAEGVFSAIGEGSLGKVYKDIIKKEGADVGSKIFKDGLVVAYQTALKKYGAPAAMLGEGLEEVATTVTQNLINEKPAFEGAMDSFIAGVGGGAVWGAPVNIAKATQGFKDGVTVHQINKTLKDQPVKTIKDVFNPNTPITNAQVNISLIPNAYKILNSQLDIAQNTDEITGEEADAIRKEFAGTYFAANKLKELKLSEDNNAKIANLLKERGALKTKVDAVNDPTLTTIQSNRIKELNVEIGGVIKDNAKTEVEKGIALSEKSILETGEKVYEKPLGSGKSFEVFDTAEEAQSAYDKWADENGKESEDITKSDGIKLPNGQMLINKERAIEVTALNVAPHELLHNIIDNEFTEPSKAEELKNKFLGTLSKTERDKLDIRILAKNEKGERLYDDEYLKNSPSEYATQFFELVRNGDIKWSDNVKESLIRMWKGIFKPIFEKYGFGNIEFTDGRDVYNFIKDYSKSIEKGTLSTRAKKLLKQGEGVTGVTSFSKTKVDEIQKKIDKLEEQYDKDEIEYDYYENQIGLYEEQLAKAKLEPEVEKPEVKKPKVAVTEEEVVREIIKNEKGTIASDKVQKIYDEKGEQGANEIIKLFKPITAKIVAKRRDAPGFNEEELTKEIELGAGGLFDLIRKFDASKGVPLAAYINKNLPLRAITASRRVLDKEFTSDVEAEVNVRATETADQGMTVNAPEKPKYKDAIESNILEPKVLKTLTNKIISTVRLLRSRIDAPVTLNRTVTPLIAEIRDDIGKQLDIDIKTMLGGKKDGVLKKELLKAKRYILENMTTTWLMGKDGQGGIPQAIQKRIDGQWTSFPNWVGQKIDREAMSTDLAGRTSGAELVRRLPNVFNNVSNEEFLAQIIGPDGNPIRGRKESVSKAMAEEIAFDITKRDLEEEGPIYDALKANQERLGVEIKETLKAEFNKQADRGNIKFSKTTNKSTALFLLEEGSWDRNYTEYRDFYNTLPTNEKRSLTWFLNRTKNLIDKYNEIWNRNLGVKYEKDTYLKLRKELKAHLKDSGLKLEESIPDRFNSIKPDLVFINEESGDNVVVELKSNVRDYVGSASNGNFINDNSAFTKSFTDIKELSIAQKENAGRTKLIDYLKQLIKEGSKDVRVTENGIQISKDLYKTLDRSKASTRNVPISIQAISDINPGKDILQIKGTGAFAFPGSKAGGVGLFPELTGTMRVTTDFRTNSAGKGWRTLLERAYFTLDPNFNQPTSVNFDTNPIDFVNKVKDSKVKNNITNINAVASSLTYSKTPKGISVFDFDDTVGLTKGSVLYTMPDGSNGKLNAEEFAKYGGSFLDSGAVFDFSEFSKVVGGKPGPMVKKMKKMIGKFGPNNFFILTARPANAAISIHDFLKSIDINIPLENITGLGNSTAQAKADWMTGKAAEGYNDFYFSDDAIQNVKAVKDALDVLDVKSKIQQARLKFSKTISPEFNKILEENVGVKVDEKFSDIVAKRKGAAIGKYRFFVPPSAADLELLTYDFLGYGKTGEEQQRFFNQALFEPYANGIALIDAAKQSIKNDYKALLKAFPEVSKDLGKLTPDGTFTYDQALRVSMWAGMGEEIPGLLKEDITKLNDFVNQDPQLSAFKAGLIATGRQGTGWVTPTEYWDSETIISDLHNITDKVGRKKYLGEFIENSQEMFSKENLNKIETIYGSNFRDALEDIIYRMSNGTNRESGPGRINAAWLNWINNSTGAIMFWNTRSAVLQTIGAINYLNWRDNNPLNAAKAFANQPQYWEDFAYIWNSDKMKERRSGLKEDVSSAEIANAAAGATNKANAVISYLLKKGFLPTQIGDSFAIASGGAPFYRNRINYNLKQGMTQEEAKANAWKEFLKVTDQTQQSGDPRDVSQQQASVAGRLVLAFQNTSMQQARLVKKAGLDLINNRGDAKTNISKIVYYTAVQNVIFGSLQSALFATIFSDDNDEEKKKKKQTTKDKWLDIGNNIVDTILRGSGLAGAVVATLKNVYLKYNEESEKGFKADYAKVLIEASNVASPLGSKFTKAYGAMRTVAFEKDVIAKRGWSVSANGRLNLSPAYTALGQGVEAATNLPMNRFVTKVNNISEAMDSRNKSWQRIALAVGYNPYVIGATNEENDIIKAEAKVQRKIEGKEKAAETRAKKKEEFAKLPWVEQQRIKKEKRLEKAKTKTKKRNIYK